LLRIRLDGTVAREETLPSSPRTLASPVIVKSWHLKSNAILLNLTNAEAYRIVAKFRENSEILETFVTNFAITINNKNFEHDRFVYITV